MSDAIKSGSVDVIIVGSGPIGATFARVIAELSRDARILMVEAGPQLTAQPGVHIKNIPDLETRTRAQIRSQGPAQFPYEVPSIAVRTDVSNANIPTAYRQRMGFLARPGTYLTDLSNSVSGSEGMPAAAHSCNVGGMGVHWTGACPVPDAGERVPFIPEDEWNRLCARAEGLLSVTQAAYPESAEACAVKQTLSDLFDHRLPEGRKVQPMPLAVQVDGSGRLRWTDVAMILGPLTDVLNDGTGRFELRSETICRQIYTDGFKATSALIEHLPSGTCEVIAAKVIVVSGDSLRTPQLLWASGIRPPALGHYLNDHPMLMCIFSLRESVIEKARGQSSSPHAFQCAERRDSDELVSAFWVPFHGREHPFHGQVMLLEVSSFTSRVNGARRDPQHVVGLAWYTRKELRYEDYAGFSATERDSFGMPKIILHYGLSPTDKATIAAAAREVSSLAAAFGHEISEDEIEQLPLGSSLHYQGSIRMGEINDSRSVCDPYSRVWGVHNLFVGGNGIIPSATACNPTLTSVALAIRACHNVVSLLA